MNKLMAKQENSTVYRHRGWLPRNHKSFGTPPLATL
jgi:hypothetical protein